MSSLIYLAKNLSPSRKDLPVDICNQKALTSRADKIFFVLALLFTELFCILLISEKEFEPAPSTIS